MITAGVVSSGSGSILHSNEVSKNNYLIERKRNKAQIARWKILSLILFLAIAFISGNRIFELKLNNVSQLYIQLSLIQQNIKENEIKINENENNEIILLMNQSWRKYIINL